MKTERLKELMARINLAECRRDVASVMRAIAEAVESGEVCITSINLDWGADKNGDTLAVKLYASLCLPRAGSK